MCLTVGSTSRNWGIVKIWRISWPNASATACLECNGKGLDVHGEKGLMDKTHEN